MLISTLPPLSLRAAPHVFARSEPPVIRATAADRVRRRKGKADPVVTHLAAKMVADLRRSAVERAERDSFCA